MSWGVNRGTKQKDVKAFLNSNKCSLVCLLETKVKAKNLGALYLNLLAGWAFTSNSMCHPVGRIILSWNPSEFQVNPYFCSSQLIHCDINTKNGTTFAYSFIYAHNSQHERVSLWKDLCTLAGNINGAWIMMGDFNCVLNTDERVGSAVRLNEIQDFQNCVNCCGTEDAKLNGNFFTWNNKQQGSRRVFSKLDRVMINHDWCTQFPNTEVCFKNEGYFDHCPGIISVYPHLDVGKKPFKFFPMWQAAPQYNEIIKLAWNKNILGTPMYQVVQKLKNVKIALKKLNKEGFGDIEALEAKTAHALQLLQDELHLNPADNVIADKEKQAQHDYMVAHKAMISFLAHKAKDRWVKEGDENTAMFHK
ncbi:uncharacterized protein [Spinacia oleracea]|uniref:Endonuclease/exonuclease/phosphatase domain-containing protein n=1 Tax=Spinacia oleracea TaxID=3562 RepID=A0A9R0JBD3_SPIOL|nr:uncharacterized protein LOC110802758 [Spinacia oleracea]